jgi:hypothetical protein
VGQDSGGAVKELDHFARRRALGIGLALQLARQLGKRLIGLARERHLLAMQPTDHRHGFEKTLHQGVASSLRARERIQPSLRMGGEVVTLPLEAAKILVQLRQIGGGASGHR